MFCTVGIFYFIFAVFTCQKLSVYFQYFYIFIALPAVRQYFVSSFFYIHSNQLWKHTFSWNPLEILLWQHYFFSRIKFYGEQYILIWILRSRAVSDGAGAEHLCGCRLLLVDSTVAVAVTQKIDNLRYKHSIILHCPVLKWCFQGGWQRLTKASRLYQKNSAGGCSAPQNTRVTSVSVYTTVH